MNYKSVIVMKNFYQKIISFFSEIGADKYIHFSCGVVVSVLIFLLCVTFVPVWLSSIISVLGTSICGALKEFLDSKLGGTVDKFDLIATALGGMIAMIPVWFN